VGDGWGEDEHCTRIIGGSDAVSVPSGAYFGAYFIDQITDQNVSIQLPAQYKLAVIFRQSTKSNPGKLGRDGCTV
jgi:hypothetical protein